MSSALVSSRVGSDVNPAEFIFDFPAFVHAQRYA